MILFYYDVNVFFPLIILYRMINVFRAILSSIQIYIHVKKCIFLDIFVKWYHHGEFYINVLYSTALFLSVLASPRSAYKADVALLIINTRWLASFHEIKLPISVSCIGRFLPSHELLSRGGQFSAVMSGGYFLATSRRRNSPNFYRYKLTLWNFCFTMHT